ncbi:DUF948 domain-containing protein [Paenibacillus sp. N3.4]|uniref:DUF948 domain-containing protein n=1 Tax=Paenibacillus sp. N3.4 TaxID=2603222 RepID=UPI0011CC0574|nr:DUF948 domain-containing protein [Paenibacillus sp. N3.4]TXK86101.1 DUF948 domain-containing protein [Paenibacillus sp. N3.4]
MTWIEISVVSAAVAFILLVGFTLRVLLAATHTLKSLGEAIVQVKKSVELTAEQAEQWISQAAQLTEEVHDQVRVLQPCLRTIEQAGAAIGDVASALGKASRVMNQSVQGVEKVVHTHQKRLQDALEWATTGFELWQRWQANRMAKSDK